MYFTQHLLCISFHTTKDKLWQYFYFVINIFFNKPVPLSNVYPTSSFFSWICILRGSLQVQSKKFCLLSSGWITQGTWIFSDLTRKLAPSCIPFSLGEGVTVKTWYSIASIHTSHYSGVVDSEDIPLNLSRELLQDSALIRRLRTVIQNRVVRFLFDKLRKDTESYNKFFVDYGIFIKEGKQLFKDTRILIICVFLTAIVTPHLPLLWK